MGTKAILLLGAGFCTAAIPCGHLVRNRNQGPTAGIWQLCSNIQTKTVENFDHPYKCVEGDLSGANTQGVDDLLFKELPGWKRAKHIQHDVCPICYIDNDSGTRIEFYVPPSGGPLHVREVRWLTVAENLSHKIHAEIDPPRVDISSFRSDALVPGPVVSGGCWVQPYGAKW